MVARTIDDDDDDDEDEDELGLMDLSNRSVSNRSGSDRSRGMGISAFRLQGAFSESSRMIQYSDERPSPPRPPETPPSSADGFQFPFSVYRSPSLNQKRIPMADESPDTKLRAGENKPLLFVPSEKSARTNYGNGGINRTTPKAVGGSGGAPKKVRVARAVDIATLFLSDYEAARPPSFVQHNVDEGEPETAIQHRLRMHKLRYSRVWREVMIHLATSFLFLASCYEGYDALGFPFCLNIWSIAIFSLDMLLESQIRGKFGTIPWTIPMIVLLASLSLEMVSIAQFGRSGRFLWASILKPIAIFYCSPKARNALEALGRIAPIVTRVLVMELLLILSFAAVACRLYHHFDSFHNLSTAWLSLFQLSTTVVNPSMWMPMYNESRTAAFFFVLFVTTSTFYLHSLVLSVVFQTYIQASTEIHERSILDREEAIELAFDSLQSVSDIEFDEEEEYGRLVGLAILEKVLRKMRPHYNAMKIHALLEILDPTGQRIIDFPTFRTKIRQALNTSIRSTPSKTPFAFLIELVAALVAVSNFIYVILLTSEFEADWFDFITFPAGFLITLLGVLELLVRFNPFRILDYAPTTRLNSTFDGLAAVAATISCYGIYRHFTAGRYTIELLLTGRAIDLIRVMRFFQIFRDVVHRSAVVFPALAGPVALVVSTHHLFVYSGMAIWGGAIQVGEHEGEITPLYDLNNFNSYWEGLVTMFQILVINDWHAIAEVYLYSTSWSSPYIVYPFFVGANLIAVCIMLNCLTAFFVGAFVTKLEGASKEDQEEVFTTVQKQREFQIDTSMRSMKRVSSSRKLLVDDSTRSTEEDDVVEFDVFEREGFDKIMRTVAGEDDDDGDEVAKELCKTLELFENLSPERPKVGYMVCCQQTLNRYGNKRFQTFATGFLDENRLHTVVSDMHAELLNSVMPKKGGSIVRTFARTADDKQLEISGSLMRKSHSSISIFVSKIR